MLPASVVEQVELVTPKINPDIANGLAVSHLKHVDKYIDSIFKAAASGFPEGLLYLGCRPCTPREEYFEMTRKKGNRSVFDVSKSDVYMMEYMFSYKGEKLPSRYLQLPYVTTGGTIVLSGSRFIISPVLADKVISIGVANIFVRLLKAKLTFNRAIHHYLEGNEKRSVQVAWSEIYNKKSITGSSKPNVKGVCTLVHYLFCKYGFTEAFRKFTGAEPVVGYSDTINETNYNPRDWIICSSIQLKPKGIGKRLYKPTEVKLAIRKDQYTFTAKNFIAGFFYIVDHFPSRVDPIYVDNTTLWKTLLGLLLWSESVSLGKLHSDINDHIASLDEYMDVLVSEKLKDIGYTCNDVYELFALVITKFDEWLLTSDDRVNTMYDKELSVLYYVTYDIIESIFRLYFRLKGVAKKDNPDSKTIVDIMHKHFKPGPIYGLTRSHGEASTTSISGDNMFFKGTSILVPQSSTSRASKKRERGAITDPSKRFHASIIAVGAVAALPKSEPTGRSRISPFLKISPTGLVLRDEENRALLDRIQEMIKR